MSFLQISNELEAKRALLQNEDLYHLYKDMVVSGLITADEFWANRQVGGAGWMGLTDRWVGLAEVESYGSSRVIDLLLCRVNLIHPLLKSQACRRHSW